MKHKYLALPTYLVALTLIVFPVLDTTLGVWPLRFGEVGWRFGMVGTFSRALMTPALGILLAFAAAYLFDQRRTLRAIAVLNALVGLLLLVTLPMFVLDFLQMRSQVRPDQQTAYDVASVVAVGKMLIGLVIFAVFAWYGFRASRKDPTVIRTESRPLAGLVGR